MSVTQVVPFFFIDDMDRSLKFYIDGVGFTMKHRWIDEGKLAWCWLELGGAALMLQVWRKEWKEKKVGSARVGLGVSLNFRCSDSIALYHEFRSRGLDPKRPFVGNGLWVTGIVDPDGYDLYFHSPADAPEETVYKD